MNEIMWKRSSAGRDARVGMKRIDDTTIRKGLPGTEMLHL